MKQKIKKLTKLTFLTFGIFLFLFNCEKDDNLIQENTTSNQAIEKSFTIKKVTLAEVTQNPSIKNSLDKIENQFDFNKLNTSKNSKKNTNSTTSALASNDPIKSKDNTFTILTDEILEVTTDSTKVFTFRIETPTKASSHFENFVIHKWDNGSIEYYIYRYKKNEFDDSNFADYSLSRDKVNSEQINLGDFDDYIQSVYYYGDGCLYDISYSDCCMFVEVLWCEGGGGGGGSGGSGTGNTSGSSGDSSSGSGSGYGNGSNGGNNTGPGGYGGSGGFGSSGGGGTSSTNNTETTNTTNDNGGTIIGVLPTRLDLEINAFFDNIPLDFQDLINPQWGQPQNSVKKIISSFLENNPGFKEIGYDGSIITNETKEFIIELLNIINQDVTVDENALKFLLEAKAQNKIYNDFNTVFLNDVNQYMDINATASNPGLIQLQIYFSTKCAVLRYNHPDWSDTKIYWEASKDIVHISLDVFGMIPVVGEIADLTNGVLYLIEGDGVNATLSFAATVPIVGWGATTGKYVFKLTATTLGTKVRLTWKVLENGIVYFGSTGSKLRKVLGITDSALQAHHLIPWATRNHNVIQKAAKSGNAFHMNEALNGIAVASWRNQPNHNTYNNLIESKLDDFNNLNPDATIDEAYNFVSDLIGDVRDWVINNPSSHLNDLILP